MKLSAPIFRLKRRARLLARDTGTPLNQALDRIAEAEGFAGWSLLAAHHARLSPSQAILSRLEDGDLLLLAGRPGQGKTVLGLQLLLDAVAEGRRGVFYTLYMTEGDVAAQLGRLGADASVYADKLSVVASDDICAAYIAHDLQGAAPGTLAVIDYLQILDQPRQTPELAEQVRALQAFARAQGVVLAFLSQVSRAYDPEAKPLPDMDDLHLPNRIDTGAFSKTCFLHNGDIRFAAML